MNKNKQVKCPLCGEYALEGDFKAGDTTYCLNCDQELKIVKLNPLKVKKLVEYPEVFSDRNNRRTRFEDKDEDDYEDEPDVNFAAHKNDYDDDPKENEYSEDDYDGICEELDNRDKEEL